MNVEVTQYKSQYGWTTTPCYNCIHYALGNDISATLPVCKAYVIGCPKDPCPHFHAIRGADEW